MSYVVDEEGVQRWNAESARSIREEDHALHSNGRLVTPADVARWWREAQEAQAACEEALGALMREHGAGPVIEALHALGVLHEDRWDDYFS